MRQHYNFVFIYQTQLKIQEIIVTQIFALKIAFSSFLIFQTSVNFFLFGELFLCHFFQSRSDSGRSLHFLRLLIFLVHLLSGKIFSLDIELCIVIFFSFGTLKMFCYFLLSSMVSDEKSVVFQIVLSLQVILFLHLFLKFFPFIFNFQTFNYDVSGC